MANNSERRILRSMARWFGGTLGTVEAARQTARPVSEHPAHAAARDTQHDFEISDLDARHTFLTGVFLLVGTWVVIALVYFMFAYLAHERAISSPPPLPIEAKGNPLPPEPRLQPSPRKDLKTERAREDWELNHYYWVDQAKGTVAIPIETAIDILAARGIPPQKQPSNLVLSQPQAGTRQTGFEGKVEPEPQ